MNDAENAELDTLGQMSEADWNRIAGALSYFAKSLPWAHEESKAISKVLRKAQLRGLAVRDGRSVP